MSRVTALFVVVVLWAGIYLPGLGSTELKGEEGRRVLPAVTMLETGNWLVPYIGGEPYLRKPPLVNWMIAGMFRITGVRNEWTARLPSALCVLVLGLGIVALADSREKLRGWLGIEASLVAAVMAMTQIGLLAKAKFAGAEIEGIYAPISGLAIVCWLAWWRQGRSPWLVWTVPGLLLGVACLAKGPSLHLLFFYAVVLAVLGRGKQLRQLWHPAHIVGVLIASAIFLAWAVPYFRTPEAAGAQAVWKRQGIDRFTESDFNARNYFTNVPRALADQLPWLAVPLLVRRSRRGAATIHAPADTWQGATAKAVTACFVGVLLIPGTLPRYVLPLGAPVALLLADLAVRSGRWARCEQLAIRIGAVFAVAMIGYALLVVPRLQARDALRPLAREIDASIPPGEVLTIHDPGYLAAIFYLRTPHRYAPRAEDIGPEVAWVLVRASERNGVEKKHRDLRVVKTFTAKGRGELLLLQRVGGTQKVPAL